MALLRIIKGHGVLIACGFAILAGCCGAAWAGDWPNWRGPNYNGISAETGWSIDWPESGPKILWKASVGTGFSSVAVSDGRLYTMGNIDNEDIIYCIDAEKGTVLWRHAYSEPIKANMYEGGPNATPTVSGGKVYTLSKSGKVFCLDVQKGKVVWSKDLHGDFGVEIPEWGLAGSPFVTENMVILNASTFGLALNKMDGNLVWKTGDGPAGYATAVPFNNGGQNCVAMFGTEEVAGINAATGLELWRFPWKTSYGVNAGDPIVSGDKVFISSGYNKGCALLEIEDSNVTEVWRNKNMRNHFNSSVLWEGFVYGFDESQLKCLDFDSGEVMWSQKGLGKGSLMIADGKLVVLSEKGKLIIAQTSAKGFEQLASAQILKGKCWTVPVLSNGRIYARNAKGDLVCVDVRQQPKAISKQADWPQWRGLSQDGKSKETGLLKSWPEGGPKLLWSYEGLGKGYSTVSIVNGTIYVTGIVNKEGTLFAFDLDGNLKWSASYGPEWTGSFPSARSTPTVDGDNIYIITGTSRVECLDASNGNRKWSVDALEKFEGKHGSWGVAESALIVDNYVICTPGGDKTSVVALDKATGETAWVSEGFGESNAYCSPLLVERGGKKIIITMIEKSVIGIDAGNGKLLWRHPCKNYKSTGRIRGIHPNTPLYQDGFIYVTSGYDMGGAKLQISEDGTKVTQVWVDKRLDVHHGGVVLVDGYIYGANWKSNLKGDWVCLDWATGKVKYQKKWKGKGCITYADGMLYCYEEKEGTVGLVKATPEGFDLAGSFQVPLGSDEHWAHPVVCGGRLYIRHGNALMAYDVKAR